MFAQPFFQGVPRVLEVGGYSNPAAWGVEQPYVGSLHPLKIVSVTSRSTYNLPSLSLALNLDFFFLFKSQGEPKVEHLNDPKVKKD